MPKKSLYIPDTIDAIIDAGEGESYSARVSHLIALAAAAGAADTPEMTFGEWVAVVTAVRDNPTSYERGPEVVFRTAWNGIPDAVDHSVGGWAIDETELARRVKAMPLAAQSAIFEVARRFWAQGHGGGTPAKVLKGLQAVGARVLAEPSRR